MHSLGRVVVTGASGFLGAQLIQRALTQGATALAVVRTHESPVPPGATRLTMADLIANPSSIDGTDLFVHAAAIRHRHGASAGDYRASNVDLTEAVLRAAQGRTKRFVLVSSVGVYGFPKALPISERSPYEPRTLYGVTKVEAERLVMKLAPSLGVPYTILRPTIIYGRGDNNGMLDKLAAMIRAGRYFVVGSGKNTLHHTYIDDIVRGIYELGTAKASENDHFILAGPETVTLAELGNLVAEVVGKRIPRVHIQLGFARAVATCVDIAAYRGLAFADREPPINNEKLDVMTVSIAFDNAKARGAGFTSRVGYREGVRRTLGAHTESSSDGKAPVANGAGTPGTRPSDDRGRPRDSLRP